MSVRDSECLFLSRVIQGYKEKILAYSLSSFIQLLVVQQSLRQKNDRQNEREDSKRSL